jgi:aspartate/methionine/tyrosine aminotransferase
VEEFCDELVKKSGVLLLPGTVYDDSDNHFRLGLGRKNLPQAIEKLELFLSR